MAKIMIIGTKEFPRKESKGGGYGRSYLGVRENGKVLEMRGDDFELEVHEGEIDFDPSKAVDLKLSTSLFGEKVSYTIVGVDEE